MELSITEENYLKSIFHICSKKNNEGAGTNELADDLSLRPASVNGMLKRLKEKKLVDYEKYGKIHLTTTGNSAAIEIVRKHRLWETFLYDKLAFSWDEVHEVAEELEHIQSKKMVDKLDQFLGYPDYDPHGDSIPDKKGRLKPQSKKTLTEVPIGSTCKMVAVKDNSGSFLKYVGSLGLELQDKIKVLNRVEFDGMTSIEIDNQQKKVSKKFSDNILVI